MTEEVRDWMRPRGIINNSHVSCHLTCALQMLIHSSPLLREILIECWRCNETGSGFLIEMGRFLANASEDCEVFINPSRIYAVIEENISINPNELGDAVLALRRILQAIRQNCAEIECLSDLMGILLEGTLVQEIIGTKSNMQRKKSTNRKMNLPFVLPGDAPSLEEALRHATIDPQHPIKGYSWGETGNYIESEVPSAGGWDCSDESTSITGWTTYKKNCLHSVPQCLLLHLQRFSMVDGNLTQLNAIMDIPLALDISPYRDPLSENTNGMYYLSGAILHVLDLKEDKEDKGGENGHYISITLVKGIWYLIDDDTVVSFEDKKDVLLELLAGRSSTFAHLENYRFTTVLATYNNRGAERLSVEFLDRLRCELVTHKNQDRDETSSIVQWDEALVGRRLGVRWSKGKFYSGIISKYDKDTGKHTVVYDDGEVREYKLSKKTIAWE
mmetsp:Transcript_24861/g.37551  ORF Transcript_24861/g.37551 Transcript_24861/m.37551 type:complete len:445 (-) Transcript_24861:72-1406(-)